MSPAPAVSRREFLAASTAAALGLAVSGCVSIRPAFGSDAIIDIHQHLGYSGRSDEQFLAHQKAMGADLTILLPAGTPTNSPATHNGASNGLEAKCEGNAACRRFAKAHRGYFLFGANEVPDRPDATVEIAKYLRLGGVVIGELKFGVECDSPEMQRIYELAAEYRVPVLMHWQQGRYNYGLERFYRMLEKYPQTIFFGHAQTWWANIDRTVTVNPILYPKGKVTPGGITDRYLTDYENMYGDLSAESGLNALTRDEEWSRDFIQRHQDKLVFGSDCSDRSGVAPACQGAQTIAAIRRLAPDKTVERKLLRENARRIFRLAGA
jgi:predicted TIM-barrel fold metal-dependent hydrolase